MHIRLLRGWLVRLYSLFDNGRREREFAEELESHLALHIEDNLRAGMSPEEARRRALVKLGGVTLTKERAHEQGGLPMLETLLQDLRFGLRMLRKNPGFTLIAVLTLGLGIGANTAIFSIVKSVLIQPLPFAESDRLMQASYLTKQDIPQDFLLNLINRRDLVDWRTRSRSFERIGAYRNERLTFSSDEAPELILGVSVTPELLPMLGIQPALGRYFLPEDGRDKRLIVLSDDLWRSRFAANPWIIGQTIRAGEDSYVVIGVMPPGFNFPLKPRNDVRFPTNQMGFWALSGDDLSRESPDDQSYNVILQLKLGVRSEQAQAEVEMLFAQRVRDNPKPDDPIGVKLVSLKEQTVGEARAILLLLLGGANLVILMVCANIASLLLVRADGRRKEMAIRQALGASCSRLMRQAFVESLLLALLGGAAGALLTAWSLKLLLQLSPYHIARLNETRIDAGTLVFTLGATALSGLLCGALPAWRSARVDLNKTLKQTAGRAGKWRSSLGAPGNLLVTVEIALAVALTLGAGLLLNSFARLMMVDTGVRTKGVSAAVIPLSGKRYPDAASNLTFFRQVIERLEATPGIDAAGTSNGLPLTGVGNALPLEIEGRPRTAASDPAVVATTHVVSPGYLRALDVPLLRGRMLNARDTANTVPVTVINETAAQRFWQGEDPIGKRLSFVLPEGKVVWRQIVGIVKSTPHFGIKRKLEPEVYVPVEQEQWPAALLFARSSLPQAELAKVMRQAVAEVDKNQPVWVINSMEDLLADSVATQRFSLSMFGGFSALALLLAAMGVYGVVAYTVAERTPEIGIRIALGAQRRDVLRLILAQGLKPLVIGSGAGIIVALALGRALSSLLFGVSSTDPLTFAGIALLFIFVALLACWIPARRATKVDPLVALRHE
jgi:putative ABC transport system permease protein